MPLYINLLITAIKQAREDVLRHISDRKINTEPVEVLRNGQFKKLKWKDIMVSAFLLLMLLFIYLRKFYYFHLLYYSKQVGDIVKVNADEIIPCDLVLLYANTAERKCYIQTANLDGETNLKVIETHSLIKNYLFVI